MAPSDILPREYEPTSNVRATFNTPSYADPGCSPSRNGPSNGTCTAADYTGTGPTATVAATGEAIR